MSKPAQTWKQLLWIEAAKIVAADPEDHQDDEEIQPVYEQLLKRYFKAPTAKETE